MQHVSDHRNLAEVDLQPHELFLWQLAQSWRNPGALSPPAGLDWPALVDLAIRNKAQSLLSHYFGASHAGDFMPLAAARSLARAQRKHSYFAGHLGAALRLYLGFAADRGQEMVVIKGLWLCHKIYGDPAMRPGADIDILVRGGDIPQTLQILEEDMGYGRWWRPLLDDRYYAHHHLHQQRCNEDRSIWIEPHWLLDHPYTQLTIDYEALFDRTTPGELWGLPVREMAWPDLMLSLAVHLVKHAVYLPHALERLDLPRLILADNMLMYFLDIHETARLAQDNDDWAALVTTANQAGAGGIMHAVLNVCARYLGTPVPDGTLTSLAIPFAGPITSRLMARLADAEISVYQGRHPSLFWSFLLGYQESIVFRPIRLLDLFHYAWPSRDYLSRRYGKAGIGRRFAHLLRAAGQYLSVGFDTVRFTLQRRREVRALDRTGFVWPPDPIDLFAATAEELSSEQAELTMTQASAD